MSLYRHSHDIWRHSFLKGRFHYGKRAPGTHRLYTERGEFAAQKFRKPLNNDKSILDKISARKIDKVASVAVLYSIMAPLFPSFVPFFNPKLGPTYFYLKAFSLSSEDWLQS